MVRPPSAAAQEVSSDAGRWSGAWEGVIQFPSHPVAFSVELRGEGGGWAGAFSLPTEGTFAHPLSRVTVSGDSVLLELWPDRAIVVRARLDGDSIAGEFRRGSNAFRTTLARPGSPVAKRLAAAVREAIEAARRSPLVEIARGPAAGRVDADALERLVRAANDAHSDALVVLKDGELVGAWYTLGESRPIEAMSVTKSIVNLAVGRLITLGAIDSLDVPVSAFYPEWNTGRKARVTLRHLLNHTSGIQAGQSTEEIYASDDFVRLALDAEVTSEPGSEFFYNNKAVNLLAGIVEKAAGRRLDLFLRDDLFAKLGITDFGWTLDPAGNPHAMSGLQIHAEDLAKLGQLVLDRGSWKGEQLIAERWFEESLRAGSPHAPTSGLLWWLTPSRVTFVVDDAQLRSLRDAGVDPAFMARAERVRGRYASWVEFEAALTDVFGDDAAATVAATLDPLGLDLHRIEYEEFIGYNANGYLGQFLVIFPTKGLVGVRMVESSPAYDPETDGFYAFIGLVYGLVP